MIIQNLEEQNIFYALSIFLTAKKRVDQKLSDKNNKAQNLSNTILLELLSCERSSNLYFFS